MRKVWWFVALFSCSTPLPLLARPAAATAPLPSAPVPGLNLAIQAPSTQPVAQLSGGAPAQPLRLTRAEAEQLAIRNNPRISVSKLLALAQHQVVRETRSAELPTARGAITAVDAENGSRISASALTASRLFEHAGAGGDFTQLITDFGRTRNLVFSQKLEEKAANSNALATTDDIVLATDEAFYHALTAQAVLEVAKQTVATRQTTQKQISELTRNKLRSTLDLSFADVNLSQAQLLQLNAENDADAAMAALDAVLGLDHEVPYQLLEDTTALTPPPLNSDLLIQQALQQRPDLQALAYDQQSSQKYARAEWEQLLPSITAEGTAGSVPIRPAQYYTSNWWGGIGINMEIPVFNGFLYSSQAREAEYRAKAASERSRDLRDRIVRDVRTAWLDANTAYQRVGVTAQLVKEADLGLQLAQARYTLGLGSIVELSQAQLQQTGAAIDNTDAQYRYRLALATLNYQIGAIP